MPPKNTQFSKIEFGMVRLRQSGLEFPRNNPTFYNKDYTLFFSKIQLVHISIAFKCDKCDTYVHPTYGKGQCVHAGF